MNQHMQQIIDFASEMANNPTHADGAQMILDAAQNAKPNYEPIGLTTAGRAVIDAMPEDHPMTKAMRSSLVATVAQWLKSNGQEYTL